MPLLRTVGRTAVIAGTASAVGGRVQHRQNEKWAAQDQQQAAAQAPPPAPVAAAPAEDPIEQLQKLGKLHEQGILTDEEFAAEKAKILNA
ncbi:MAG TPA: SHOCT domain-containing protein [Solirubrobacteraceae bacterium]|nr:SHOCT domain-containing protein [Solirubrobacteraceae bacterium]